MSVRCVGGGRVVRAGASVLGFPQSPALPRHSALATDGSAAGLDGGCSNTGITALKLSAISPLCLTALFLSYLFTFRHYQQTKLHNPLQKLSYPSDPYLSLCRVNTAV